MDTENSILYVSYDGILEPLGRSQVLAYLEGLSNRNKIYLISFEKKADLNNPSLIKTIKDICLVNNIEWKPFTYHKRLTFIATIFDILVGTLFSTFLTIKHSINIIHIRSYIPGLMVLISMILLKKKLIFDMRGFWADEKADRSGWRRQGRTYKFFKTFERFLIEHSDHIVCLTKESKMILLNSYSVNKDLVSVIPTCVDQSIFYPKKKKNKDITVFGHLGSVDTAYDIDPVLEFIKIISSSLDVRIDFFNKGNHSFIKERCSVLGLKSNLFSIKDVDRTDLSDHLSQIDIGCFYAKENFSIKASMPTKIGEFLSCGKPILCNGFNNDVKDLIEVNKVGLLYDLDNSDIEMINLSLMKLLEDPDLSKRCELLASSLFSLDRGIELYKQIYRSV